MSPTLLDRAGRLDRSASDGVATAVRHAAPLQREGVSSPLARTVMPRRFRMLIAQVRHGRFERSLSALTAMGSAVTAAEIYFEHDRASFGRATMWWPVILGPVGTAAGIAGVCSARMARTALPLVSAAIIANGIQGTYLHLRGVMHKPGGLRHNALFNIETGPPLLAPLLVTLVGGMGLVASVLRRES